MYLISYDISKTRRRNKIAKTLENYGKRVQYSVFECQLSGQKYEELYGKLLRLMLGEEQDGSIRIYTLCANCVRKTILIGVEEEKPADDDGEVVIV